ncbi:putative membrane protein [Candidatus Methanoperedens nitroreducens]|uniref:Putative membrane protein n=1 Tax=Candidatus Methanoperedens nitratireducens TaxID=1392998 RepID=A0A062V3G2_9EURY|nr:heparan-alpha-glucosaminide N-acetyltransferase [Candidatus Methanoperedens nitroreducens]KCZ73626.1 putative membrane protein [Candidatus Methanoperedens nitroreducens]MDJ1422417.1 heparan-alpha-glucosaminide N-acetyltransferase [Candidatus Methanoperedens sp.]
MTTYGSLLKDGERIQAIDLIRGVDIILMVLFNYSVTLSYFGLIYLSSSYLYWFIFPRSIASIFIFLSGVVAYISYEKSKNFNKRYFVRGLKLLLFAFLITLFTYILVPERTIYFGILHFFAVSSFLVPFFIKYSKLNLIAGVSIILSGLYLQRTEFDFPYLLWLGLIPENFSTFDYFPLIPWLGVLLLGAYSGKYITRRANRRFKSKLAGIFISLGKNSLTVYLIHQPVLVFLLIIMGFKLD